jgi:RNA polymerase sigma-70 factor (ECF subfamily)
MHEPDPTETVSPEALRVLVENHERFLAFLTRRVASRDVAEEILQSAFVRGLDRIDSLRKGESVTAWFYRLLRNALIDHYRRQDAEQRALQKVALAQDRVEPPFDEALMEVVCTCVASLVSTLKPEYAAAIRRVDLEGATVSELAAEASITTNNASVRLHRAHEALRRQLARCCGTCATHGCLDCSCKERPEGASV